MSLEGMINASKTKRKTSTALWTGPSGVGPNGGITYSMLCKFLSCRERFRLHAVEGLQLPPTFNHKLEYGNMWHVCEESYAATGGKSYEAALKDYVTKLCSKFSFNRDVIGHWYEVCKRQFPLYVKYWDSHLQTDKTNLLQETPFDVTHLLPSGRTVRLRGKWDSVDVIGNGVWLQENKTKGDIDVLETETRLKCDLQTMIYLIALRGEVAARNWAFDKKREIVGTRYNVVRRPLSGGKGTIRQHQPTRSNPAGESKEAFYDRVAQYIKDDPEHFFRRWEVRITSEESAVFAHRVLNPILEQLCDWYEWVTSGVDIWKGKGDDPDSGAVVNRLHWQHPYGVWNPTNEGVETEYDNYLQTGNEVGLTREGVLFPELQT